MDALDRLGFGNISAPSTLAGATLIVSSTGVSFNGAAPVAKPTINGSRSDGSAVASIIAAFVTYGLADDSTTA